MTHSLEPGGFAAAEPTAASTWHWRLEDGAGAEVRAASVTGHPRFPSQGDAESWLGETWRQLVEDGVDGVTLFEGDRRVYGPMSLHPPG